MVFKKKIFIFFAVILMFVYATPGYSSFESNTTKHILDNGMTVLIREIPSSPVVAVYALVKTGSATEGKYLGTGISHFLEHMLFKGTKTRGVGEIPSLIQDVGGSINASTGKDHTIYTVNVPYEKFDVGLDVLSDMLMNAVMDPDEVEKERDVVVGEMKLHNDNPSRRLSQISFENVYSVHPYRHPVIGYENLFLKISRDDISDYYKYYYAPNNIILTIAGNVKAKDILPKIRETFKGFERQRYVVRNLPDEPEQITHRFYEEEYATDFTRMSMAFSGTSLLDSDLFALDVLAMILGRGQSSRLYQSVYKKGKKVYSISAQNYTPVDRGAFEIESMLDYPNIEDVQDSIWEQINLVKTKGVTKKELDKAKRQVLTGHIRSLQTAAGSAFSQGFDEAFAGSFTFSDEYVKMVKKVLPEDIVRVTKQYLINDKLTTVILKPKQDDVQKEDILPKKMIEKPQKIVLDNGVKILLKEDHSFPLVSMSLFMQGGLRQESILDHGAFNLLAQMWLKGTKSLSSQQISQKIESLGAQFNAFSGMNSFGLNMNLLSEDFDSGFDLFWDVLRNPTFPEDEMPLIKKNLKAGLQMRKDNISSFTSYHLKQLLFLKHPIRRDVRGTVESIDQLQKMDIKSYYDKFLSAENMVVAVFGDFDSEQMLKVLTKKFSSFKSKNINIERFNEEAPTTLRKKVQYLDKEQAMIMYGFHGTTMFDKDQYPLKVLATILGSSFKGRLFNNVREKLGKAYSVGGYFSPNVDAGMIVLYVLTTDENVEEVESLLNKEILKLQSILVSKDELENVKTFLKGRNKSGLETIDSQLSKSGFDELYGLGYLNYENYDQDIDQVTAEDVMRVAQKYLDLQKGAVVITRPSKNGVDKKN